MKKVLSIITFLCLSTSALAAPIFNTAADLYDGERIDSICQNPPGTYAEPYGEYLECLFDWDDMMFQKKTCVNYQFSPEDKYLPEQFELSFVNYYPETSRTLFRDNGIAYVYSRFSSFSFEVPSESVEKVNEYLMTDEALGENYIAAIARSYFSKDGSDFRYHIEFNMQTAYEQARKIKKEVQKITDVKNIELIPSVYKIQPMYTFMLTYCPELPQTFGYGIKGVTLDEIKETLENYVAENDLDYTVELFTGNYEMISLIERGHYYGYKLVPKGEVSFADQGKLCKQIYDDLGYNTWYSPDMMESDSAGGTYASDSIDMSDNVDGDANCDGKYTIADSTAILQSLGNPDKYGLSLQGEFNADIYNVGDGVTPMDALEVQKAMASKG